MQTRYYARLDDQDNPVVLYRGTPEMEEQVWGPTKGWQPAEFLLDVLEGNGNTYAITEEQAKQFFPAEAFL